MAVTNNVLNAINVFSSTSVFNSNKGSVGANDLNFIKQTTAELATEGGGIIAQSLGTNGYVKFANGLILQWCVGGGASGQQSTTWPLAMSVLYRYVEGNYRSGTSTSGEYHYVVSYDATTIKADYDGSGHYKYFIAIGK